jgi:flagellar biosynthetic protein FliO
MLALIQVAAGQGAGQGYVEIIWWDYAKILLALGVMVAAAWAFLRYVAPRIPSLGVGGAAGPIRVLARYPLEPRKTLYVVRVGEETLLIGAADNSIAMLKALPPETFPESAAADAAKRTPSAFFKTLSNLQQRK